MVDLHAITLPHDPIALQEDTRKAAALYMACGIDPAKSVIFVQSHVAAHAELAWLLMTQTPVGWLNRMIQWKEKSRKVVRAQLLHLSDHTCIDCSDQKVWQI